MIRYNKGFLTLSAGPVCHCVSGDFAMGAGFAAQMPEHRAMLHERYENLNRNSYIGGYEITQIGNELVAHLVTKERVWHKPTLEHFKYTLAEFSGEMYSVGITEWHCPKIGCGLDMLDWKDVSKILEKLRITFNVWIP